MAEATDQVTVGSPHDPLPEALGLARAAAQAGLGLKLLGGLGVRVLCPDFPPRLRRDQDIDFACLSKERKKIADWLARNGCEPDRRFNNLNGERQMYFAAPSGRPVDVMVDRLTMCHALDFRPCFGQLPLTVAAVDLLLSKLQIVELNAKDALDIVHLLSALPMGTAESASPVIDTGRFGRVLGADWGWWRTVTKNLTQLPAVLAGNPELTPPAPHHDPLAQARRLLDVANSAPKSAKWKLRSSIGDRLRWYELPEEVAH
jgi:hypothetical protein